MKSILFLLAVIWATSNDVYAGTQEMIISGVSLRLGMQKSDVVAALGRCCKLEYPANNENEIQILKMNTEADLLGVVYFSSGKLSAVGRAILESPSKEAAKFVRALRDSLEDGNSAGLPIRVTLLTENEFPDVPVRTIRFEVGNKVIELSTNPATTGIPGSVGISETIGSR